MDICGMSPRFHFTKPALFNSSATIYDGNVPNLAIVHRRQVSLTPDAIARVCLALCPPLQRTAFCSVVEDRSEHLLQASCGVEDGFVGSSLAPDA